MGDESASDAPSKGLRPGWTTGTCASAAAKAAAQGLVTGVVPPMVEVGLPGGTRVAFDVENPGMVEPVGGPATAIVVKDAGDDPDCTDGARMTAAVSWAPEGPDLSARRSLGDGRASGDSRNDTGDARDPRGVTDSELRAGAGIGTVTKPGLGLEVGAPAINPVPRRMILAALAEVTDRRLIVSFSVPGGEEMAAKTTSERLGIIGGISILGTTGIVRPFSTAAYRASVVQQIDVASAQGLRHMVLCTGSRSETAATRLYPELDPISFVEVGDFTGIALRRCVTQYMTSAVIVAMAGKITKLAAGVMMTHFHRSKVDTELLEEVARVSGSPQEILDSASATATARHFAETCISVGFTEPLRLLCEMAREHCVAHAGGSLGCEVVMVDFDGKEVLGRA